MEAKEVMKHAMNFEPATKEANHFEKLVYIIENLPPHEQNQIINEVKKYLIENRYQVIQEAKEIISKQQSIIESYQQLSKELQDL